MKNIVMLKINSLRYIFIFSYENNFFIIPPSLEKCFDVITYDKGIDWRKIWKIFCSVWKQFLLIHIEMQLKNPLY